MSSPVILAAKSFAFSSCPYDCVWWSLSARCFTNHFWKVHQMFDLMQFGTKMGWINLEVTRLGHSKIFRWWHTVALASFVKNCNLILKYWLVYILLFMFCCVVTESSYACKRTTSLSVKVQCRSIGKRYYSAFMYYCNVIFNHAESHHMKVKCQGFETTTYWVLVRDVKFIFFPNSNFVCKIRILFELR